MTYQVVYFFCFCFLGHAACGILVPQPGIDLILPAMKPESQPLDHQGSPPIHFIPMLRSLDKGWDVDLGAFRFYYYEEIGPHKILL